MARNYPEEVNSTDEDIIPKGMESAQATGEPATADDQANRLTAAVPNPPPAEATPDPLAEERQRLMDNLHIQNWLKHTDPDITRRRAALIDKILTLTDQQKAQLLKKFHTQWRVHPDATNTNLSLINIMINSDPNASITSSLLDEIQNPADEPHNDTPDQDKIRPTDGGEGPPTFFESLPPEIQLNIYRSELPREDVARLLISFPNINDPVPNANSLDDQMYRQLLILSGSLDKRTRLNGYRIAKVNGTSIPYLINTLKRLAVRYDTIEIEGFGKLRLREGTQPEGEVPAETPEEEQAKAPAAPEASVVVPAEMVTAPSADETPAPAPEVSVETSPTATGTAPPEMQAVAEQAATEVPVEASPTATEPTAPEVPAPIAEGEPPATEPAPPPIEDNIKLVTKTSAVSPMDEAAAPPSQIKPEYSTLDEALAAHMSHQDDSDPNNNLNLINFWQSKLREYNPMPSNQPEWAKRMWTSLTMALDDILSQRGSQQEITGDMRSSTDTSLIKKWIDEYLNISGLSKFIQTEVDENNHKLFLKHSNN